MTTSGHTPEPWAVTILDGVPFIRFMDSEGVHIKIAGPITGRWWYGQADKDRTAESIANAERIVACVNGCAGLNPEAVPELLAACRMVVMAQQRRTRTAEEQEIMDAARAAIAKATGGL